MKMLKERVRAAGITLQDHELKYKAEKAWRDVKRAGIVLKSIAPVAAGMLEHQIADSKEDVRRKELNLDPMASSQRLLVDARDAREDQMLRNESVGNLGLNPEAPLIISIQMGLIQLSLGWVTSPKALLIKEMRSIQLVTYQYLN